MYIKRLFYYLKNNKIYKKKKMIFLRNKNRFDSTNKIEIELNKQIWKHIISFLMRLNTIKSIKS